LVAKGRAVRVGKDTLIQRSLLPAVTAHS
jgi:hypothetical protein